MKKLITAFLLAAALALPACSSDGGGAGEELAFVPLEGWQTYSLVRPDEADGITTDAAVELRGAIEALGAKLTIGTDWVKRGEPMPVGTPEILIGMTNRPESLETELLARDYVVAYTGGRVVINGGSGAAVAAAVDWFTENCIDTATGSILVPTQPYVLRGEYPLKDVTIDGIPLSEYAVTPGAELVTQKTLIASLGSYLADGCGTTAKKSDHWLMLEYDPSMGYFDVSVKSGGGKITLAVNGGGVSIEEAVKVFCDLLENRSGDAITKIDERTKSEMENFKSADAAQVGEWRDMTDERIEAIRNTPNMKIPEGATVYYISPNGDDANDGKSPETAWKTLTNVNNLVVRGEQYVLFERGGFWRGQLKCRTDITYSAYGEGEKPTFTTSPEDGAGAEKWLKTDVEGIWKYHKSFEVDVGTLIFDGGEAHAIKVVVDKIAGVLTDNTNKVPFTDYHDLKNDLNFYMQDGTLYIKSAENPGSRFGSIEFNIKEHGFSIGGNNITIDNIRMLYVGAHGISAGSTKNLTVQNSELGWIGGVIQTVNKDASGDWHTVRYGNAVQIWGGCDGFTVTDCYVYQCYDAGLTPQWKFTDQQVNGKSLTDYSMKNILFARNVIENCMYSIEYWMSNIPVGNKSHIAGYVIEDNYMWNAGYGLSEQRYNPGAGSHIKGGGAAADYVVRNNYFIGSKNYFALVSGGANEEYGTDMPSLENNILAFKVGTRFGVVSNKGGSSIMFTVDVPAYLGELDVGNTYYFIED